MDDSSGPNLFDYINQTAQTAGKVYQYVHPPKAGSAPSAPAPPPAAAAPAWQKYILPGAIGLGLLIVLGIFFGGRRG